MTTKYFQSESVSALGPNGVVQISIVSSDFTSELVRCGALIVPDPYGEITPTNSWGTTPTFVRTASFQENYPSAYPLIGTYEDIEGGVDVRYMYYQAGVDSPRLVAHLWAVTLD